MNIHEYQGKELFHKYGVTVPRGRVADTPEEAEAIAKELGGTGRGRRLNVNCPGDICIAEALK